ncbi:MAG: UvrD-helicase domain-containing protein [Anaerolineales bacterium]|nr:UvrD-helicase domain-containing protein [Anaerolineales bacterium]
MPAQVYGELRPDATQGEKIVLKQLRDNLPKEYSIYVECPLPSKHRIQRFPDFIVLTNYGVIVLEVKDWVALRRADRYHAEVITRTGETRQEKNPVVSVRDMALALENLLKTQGQKIDWGYAVILPNLPPTILANLRIAWGETQVLGQDDLRPNIVLKRLSATRPSWSNHTLSREQLRAIRQIINPLVEFEHPQRPAIVLDEVQERIVLEPTRSEQEIPKVEKPVAQQLTIGVSEAELVKDELPKEAQHLVQSLHVRLVRGAAGSGKTIVLTQRARYLAAQYPEWNILVLTYNRPLSEQLQQILSTSSNVKVSTLHALCLSIWEQNGHKITLMENTLSEWVKGQQTRYPIIRKVGASFLAEEIKWIKDVGFEEQSAYLLAIRRGLGKQRLSAAEKSAIYEVMEAFDRRKDALREMDWAEFPTLTWKALKEGKLQTNLFDAILIDEAQDFAPQWIQIVKALLKPNGLLFLADDPSQSIFRFFSWREKGVEVVGRTRHLKVPYRNTYEIYRAASSLIENDPLLKEQLREEEFLPAEIDPHSMRHGPKPILAQQASFEQECRYLHDQVRYLIQKGFKTAQILILHPRRNKIEDLTKALRGTGVTIETLLRAKGLEFDVVFISQAHLIFENATDSERTSHALRQLFMAMTRARQQLTLCYQGALPRPLQALEEHVEWVRN